MAKTQYTKAALKEAIAGKLQRHFACEVKDAKKDQIYEACALVIRDALTENMIETQNEVERDGDRQVHYLCMEFLVGRSLRNHAYNVWFTLIGDSWEAMCDTLDGISARHGIPILNLPAARLYKIRVDFPMEE